MGISKNANHKDKVDKTTKQTENQRKAEARQLMRDKANPEPFRGEDQGQGEPHLQTRLQRLHSAQLQQIMVDAYRNDAVHKIQPHRTALNNPRLPTEHDQNSDAPSDGTPANPVTPTKLDHNEATPNGTKTHKQAGHEQTATPRDSKASRHPHSQQRQAEKTPKHPQPQRNPASKRQRG
ncbi:hypothetical protein [endosymbiont of Riftia pachyptila]|uniref:hypothetical protein n=1 Tax=endosymbiont of Riftia pachyptila TaxID=54396 RepID=UPI003B84AC87